MLPGLLRRTGPETRDAEAERRRVRRLQSVVALGVAYGLVVVPVSQVLNAERPVAAAGIALQTVAGLLTAIQLWANSASDALVRWAARQIAVNRWHVAGLFDGRIRSLVVATGWFVLGLSLVRIPLDWAPSEAIAWSIAILTVLVLSSGAVVYVLATFMLIGNLLASTHPPPDGKAVSALRGRLAANDWIWPLIGLAFVSGGVLQIVVS